jgi:hypothetical protein
MTMKTKRQGVSSGRHLVVWFISITINNNATPRTMTFAKYTHLGGGETRGIEGIVVLVRRTKPAQPCTALKQSCDW